MRDPSPSLLRRPILAALLLALTACSASGEKPKPALPAKTETKRPVSHLETWRQTGDRAALAAAWSEQLASEDAAGWTPLLQSTAFRIAALRGKQIPPALADDLARFASHEGLAKHHRLDPRLVLPVAELLWDNRDAAGLLRLAEVFGKPPHDKAYRFLRSAAEEVTAREPATLRITATCDVTLNGSEVTAGAPLQVAPGSHFASCKGGESRLIRVAPGATEALTLP